MFYKYFFYDFLKIFFIVFGHSACENMKQCKTYCVCIHWMWSIISYNWSHEIHLCMDHTEGRWEGLYIKFDAGEANTIPIPNTWKCHTTAQYGVWGMGGGYHIIKYFSKSNEHKGRVKAVKRLTPPLKYGKKKYT